MIAGGNRPSLTEARAETGDGFMGVGLSIQSNILPKNGMKSAKNFIAAPPWWAMAEQGTAIKSK